MATFRLRSRFLAKTFQALVVTIILLILVSLSSSSRPVHGAPSDMLHSIFVTPIPDCAYFSAGVAFDGGELLISCVFSNVITRVSPVDGTNLGSLIVDGISASEGITAMSWDTQNRRLWVGSATVIPQKVYTVVLDKAGGRGTATFQFAHTPGGGESWMDGLAFDPTDGTIWLGPDGQMQIYHYTQAGTLLGSINVASWIGTSHGKSGIVVGSPTKLYVANDGGSQIFSVNKDGTSPTLFANVPANKRVEDLECDTVTFAPKSVIWSKYSFDDYELNAYEVPVGDCLIETVEFLLFDEDHIDNGTKAIEELAEALGVDPAVLVNDDIANPGVRTPLFSRTDNNPPAGTALTLPTGQVGDWGLFRLTKDDPQESLQGTPSFTRQELFEASGAAADENNLDKIRDILPLGEADLAELEGKTVCLLGWDSDISWNPGDPNNADKPPYAGLMGATLGLTAYKVTGVVPPPNGSSSELSHLEVELLDWSGIKDICGVEQAE